MARGLYSGALSAQNPSFLDLPGLVESRVELVTKDAFCTVSLSSSTGVRAARWPLRNRKKKRAHRVSARAVQPPQRSNAGQESLNGHSLCTGEHEHNDEVCEVVVEVCPDEVDWEGSWQGAKRFPAEHRYEEDHQDIPLCCRIGETSTSSWSTPRLTDSTEQPTSEEGLRSSSPEHHSWTYSKLPERDALADLQADVALAIPSWYYRITGIAPEATYGHDLQEASPTLSGDESLLAEPPPQAGRSIILIPPYQRVALATELLIASFTGGMTSADDDNNEQDQPPARKRDFDAAALVSKVPLLALEARETSHVDWERGDLDPPGFFLAPEEEAMLQQLSANATAIWDVESSSGSGDVATGNASGLYSWPVLLSTVTCGCVAGLMAMRSEAPVLAVDIFLITWSACVTAVAASVVGVLKHNSSSSGSSTTAMLPSASSHPHHPQQQQQQTAYEGPAKRRLWSRVVLVMGTIAAMLAASTCLALVVRAMVSAIVIATAAATSVLPKLTAAVGLLGVASSTSATTSAVLHPLLSSSFFAVSVPVVLLAAGLFWMSNKGKGKDKLQSNNSQTRTQAPAT